GELTLPHDTYLHPCLCIVLLQILGELLVGFISDDGQLCNPTITNAFTFIVHRQPEPAADGLAAFCLSSNFTQGAYLEDVWVIPALTQSRVRKDETHRL